VHITIDAEASRVTMWRWHARIVCWTRAFPQYAKARLLRDRSPLGFAAARRPGGEW